MKQTQEEVNEKAGKYSWCKISYIRYTGSQVNINYPGLGISLNKLDFDIIWSGSFCQVPETFLILS